MTPNENIETTPEVTPETTTEDITVEQLQEEFGKIMTGSYSMIMLLMGLLIKSIKKADDDILSYIATAIAALGNFNSDLFGMIMSNVEKYVELNFEEGERSVILTKLGIEKVIKLKERVKDLIPKAPNDKENNQEESSEEGSQESTEVNEENSGE